LTTSDVHLGLNKHKLGLVVNDNTEECNVSQEKRRKYHDIIHVDAIGINAFCKTSFLETSQESHERLISLTQHHRVLISLPLSPLQRKSVRLIRAENERTQLCLQIELAEEKSQPLHSHKSPW